MIYLDPPFFTEKKHKLRTRSRTQEFSFDDLWGSHKKYAKFMADRLILCQKCLSDKGIDAILKQTFEGGPILVRVQREHESVLDAASLLAAAAKKKGCKLPILVKTQPNLALFPEYIAEEVYIVNSASMGIAELINALKKPCSRPTGDTRRVTPTPPPSPESPPLGYSPETP
jgi:hypothetical protein